MKTIISLPYIEEQKNKKAKKKKTENQGQVGMSYIKITRKNFTRLQILINSGFTHRNVIILNIIIRKE